MSTAMKTVMSRLQIEAVEGDGRHAGLDRHARNSRQKSRPKHDEKKKRYEVGS